MKICLLSVLIGLATPLLAQVPTPQPLRLKEGLELAIANSANVEKARLDRQGLEQRLKEARNAAYPRMTANLDVDYSPVLPTQIMPGEVVGQPGTFIPVQFGRAWQASADVSQTAQFAARTTDEFWWCNFQRGDQADRKQP